MWRNRGIVRRGQVRDKLDEVNDPAARAFIRAEIEELEGHLLSAMGGGSATKKPRLGAGARKSSPLRRDSPQVPPLYPVLALPLSLGSSMP